jgi:hypothetical protein
LPTIEETLRIKTFLVVDRNATRDYLDVAALSHHIGLTKSAAALERMNELYAEFKDQAGDLLTAVVVKLSLPDPYDLTDIDLSEYKGIVAPRNDWRAVQGHARLSPRRWWRRPACRRLYCRCRRAFICPMASCRISLQSAGVNSVSALCSPRGAASLAALRRGASHRRECARTRTRWALP